jgi:hypothetical protein
MSANPGKKIKLNKVREIIVTRLRDDLRQPTLLKSAIEQGRKERDTTVPIFTKKINPFPQQRFDLGEEDTRETNLRLESNLKETVNPKKETRNKRSNLFIPIPISKMIG